MRVRLEYGLPLWLFPLAPIFSFIYTLIMMVKSIVKIMIKEK